MRPMPVLILIAATAVTLAAQTPMRPGKWTVTMQMEMPNMPPMPEFKTEQCITAEDLKRDPASGLPNASRDPKSKDACKMSDYKVDGEHVTWKVACTGQGAMTGVGDMTVKGDSYAGVMKMTMAQGEVTMKMSGKRIGDCVK